MSSVDQVLQIFPEKSYDIELLRLNLARLAKIQNLDPETQRIRVDAWCDEICVHVPQGADVDEFKRMLNEGFAPARVEEYDDEN
jgi:hypothetical protein